MNLISIIEAMVRDYIPKLYHFTTEANALKIMEMDQMLAGEKDEYYLQLDKRLGASKSKNAVSLTRDKMLNTKGLNLANKPQDEDPDAWGDKLNVVFVLNSDKLKTKYKIEPFNYDALDKYHGIPVTKNKEFEERVMTDRIPNLHRYVVNIEYRGNNMNMIKAIDKYEESIKRKKEEVEKNIQRF